MMFIKFIINNNKSELTNFVFLIGNRFINMTSSIYSALSTSAETPEIPKVQKVSKRSKRADRKKKTPKVGTTVTLEKMIADFEYYYPICVILFHYNGKDQFLVFNLKFSYTFWLEFSVRSVKEITLPIIETIFNEKTKGLGKAVVWKSYFEGETLKRLTDQEYFKTPSEFKTTFDLVRGEPISRFSYSPAIMFDFRISNSKQEFVYLPNGSRVYFGKAFDDFRIEKNRSKLESMMRHYDSSLDRFDFDEICDARDKIFRLTGKNPDYEDDRHFADEALRFITKYVYLYNRDKQVELRNLLQFKNWDDDLKKEYERALEYRNHLLKLLEIVEQKVNEARICREKARELQDEEAYPSLS